MPQVSVSHVSKEVLSLYATKAFDESAKSDGSSSGSSWTLP